MKRSDSAVSSVVGVVLLLLLVVAAASVIGLTLSTATQNAVESTPNVQFIPSADPQMLYHGGGDVLYKDRLVFYSNGVDITNGIEIDSTNTWTEWRTGQAIELPAGYYVANLMIIALDSLGREQQLYRGSGITPTPSLLPDASFTLTLVSVGQEVSPLLLPASLASTADHFVVMEEAWLDEYEWIERYWVDGDYVWEWIPTWWGGYWVWVWVDGYWVEGHWEGGYTTYAYVEFTAVETEGVTYSWSSTGPDSNVDDPTSNPGYIRFNTAGDCSITLQVTNTTSGLSNSSTQTVSVRNPGLTVMTWVSSDKTSNSGVFAYNGSNPTTSIYYQWKLSIPTQNRGYSLQVNVASGTPSSYTISSYQSIPAKNTWYHVTGTYEQDVNSFDLDIYVNGGYLKHAESTTIKVISLKTDSNWDTQWLRYSNHDFTCDPNYSYEIPFAMTESEIQEVYNAEKNLPKS